MCDDCRERQEKLRSDVVQLLNHEGPIWEDICEKAEADLDISDEIYDDACESVALEMAVFKLALIAGLANNGPYSAEPITAIIGQWAGHALEMEMGMAMRKRRGASMN